MRFTFSGTLLGRPVSGAVADGALDADPFVVERVNGFIEHRVPVTWVHMSGPARLRGWMAPATIEHVLDEGSARFEGLPVMGPELPDLEGAVSEAWGGAAARAKQAGSQLRVGSGNEGGGRFSEKVVPAIGKGQPTTGSAVGKVPTDARDLFREDGKTIFGHTLPPGIVEITDPAERSKTRVPKGYPHAFTTPDGKPTPAGVIGWGVDSQGRVKRFYTDEAMAERAKAKFQRIRKLSRKLDRFDAELAKDSMDDDAASLALLVRATGMRPGSEGKTGGKVQAFGATTLQAQHVNIDGDLVTFDFVGKNGKPVSFEVHNHLLARSLGPRVEGKPEGEQIFPGVNERQLNAYLKDSLGAEFKTKDLRTVLATATAQAAVREMVVPESKRERLAVRKRIAEQISERLGNTPAEVIKSYVDPQVWEPLGL